MTEEQLEELYKEVKEVLFDKGLNHDNMTDCQVVFSAAFEDSAFGTDMLSAYSHLVHLTPGVTLRQLHAFCIGHALGKKYVNNEDEDIDLDKTFH